MFRWFVVVGVCVCVCIWTGFYLCYEIYTQFKTTIRKNILRFLDLIRFLCCCCWVLLLQQNAIWTRRKPCTKKVTSCLLCLSGCVSLCCFLIVVANWVTMERRVKSSHNIDKGDGGGGGGEYFFMLLKSRFIGHAPLFLGYLLHISYTKCQKYVCMFVCVHMVCTLIVVLL